MENLDIGTGGVDQQDYVSDAMSGIGDQSSVEAQTPKEAQQQAQTPKDAGVSNVNKQEPVKPTTPADPIDAVFKNDKGEFDAAGFMNFSLPENFSLPAEKSSGQGSGQPQALQQEPADNRPEWQREMEEISSYEKSLSSHVLDPLQKVAELISGGRDPMQALNEVFAERKRVLDEHMAEYKYKRDFERRERLQKATGEAEAMAKMKVNASTNVNAIVSALPGNDHKAKSELFSHVMFSKEIGAPILNREFLRRNPDAKKLPIAEQEKLADKFLLEVQSDREELSYFWQLCIDRATRLKQKDVAQRNRLLGAAQQKEQRQAAQKNPAGPYNRKPVVSGGKNEWDSYFGSSVDRV